MEEWKEYRLREVCDLIPGFAFKSGDFGNYTTKVIKIKDIIPPFVYLNEADGVNLKNYDANRLSKFIVKKDDFILAMTGATIGKIGRYVDETQAYLNQRVLKFLPKDNVDSKYIYYSLITQMFKLYVVNHIDSESAQPNISANTIGNYPILLPSLNTQRKISAILKSLDDKIENNRKINENLEQQAQALFKSWFVDFEPFRDQPFVDSELGPIPQGWKVERIGNLPIEVTDFVANGSFASLKENVTLYQRNEYAYFIRNVDLKSGNFSVFVDKKSYEFLSKSKLFGGEIIISNVGDVGSVHLCPRLNKPMTLGNNIIMIKSGLEPINIYLYILFKWSYGKNLIQSIKGGSAQPKFNKTDFKSLNIILPPTNLLNSFFNLASQLMKKIEFNKKESDKLNCIRDTLLPKLMSGEIKV